MIAATQTKHVQFLFFFLLNVNFSRLCVNMKALSLQQCVCFYRLWNLLTRHHTVLNSARVSHTFPQAPFKNTLICSLCCSTQQHIFGPMDYESLQKELALKDTVWTKVSPTECNEDSSTTVVYRMETVGDGN